MREVIVLDRARSTFAAVTLGATRNVAEPADRQRDRGEDEREQDPRERHLLRRVRQCSSTPRAKRTVTATNHTVNGTMTSTVVVTRGVVPGRCRSCRVAGSSRPAL